MCDDAAVVFVITAKSSGDTNAPGYLVLQGWMGAENERMSVRTLAHERDGECGLDAAHFK